MGGIGFLKNFPWFFIIAGRHGYKSASMYDIVWAWDVGGPNKPHNEHLYGRLEWRFGACCGFRVLDRGIASSQLWPQLSGRREPHQAGHVNSLTPRRSLASVGVLVCIGSQSAWTTLQ